MSKLQQLKSFLDRYSDVYREKYSTPPTMYVSMNFMGNHGMVYFRELLNEPAMAVGEYWFSGPDTIRKCISDQPDTVGGFLKTYEIVTDWDSNFDTTLQFIGEELDLGYYLNTDGAAVISYLGAILASDGKKFQTVLAGPEGSILTADSTAPSGVSWQEQTPSEDSDDDLTWEGQFNPSYSYHRGDIVKFEDNTYVYVNGMASAGVSPPAPSHWDLFVPKGSSGLEGPEGPIGVTGESAVNWRNVWNNTDVYIIGDAVQHNGTSYRCVTSTSVEAPPNANWEVFAAGAEAYVVSRSYVAAEDICENRVVVTNDAGDIVHANPHDVDHAFRLVGVSAHNANTGQSCKVVMYGFMQCPEWVFTPGKPIFVAALGKLSHAPPATGFLATIARPVSTSAINIGIYECPIIL